MVTEGEYTREIDGAEAARLAAALRDPSAWPRPSDGFELRCFAALGVAPSARLAQRPRRWARIAAAAAALMAFAGFAMYRGLFSGAGSQEKGETPVGGQSAPTDDLDVLMQEGGDIMIARRMAGVVGAAMVSVAVSAAELTSEPTLVFLRPETSSFWNTATNNTMTVPVDFPSGATSATLTIRGVGYSASYLGIEKGTDSFTFALPVAENPQTENVYELTLAFDDGTVHKARLGLIEGVSPNPEGVTRCLAPSNGRVWSRVKGGRAVLPIPYGVSSFSVVVNGETRSADTGLNGAQGWYALGLRGGEEASLSMIAGGLSYSASLLGASDGTVVILQ